MRECEVCRGDGGRWVRPTDKQLREFRNAVAAAEAAGDPVPERPGLRRTPCKHCRSSGLVAGKLPEAPANGPVVAVVGGGIGGAAVALALLQRGIRAVVYERDDCFAQRAQGYGLTMQQGANALRDLGLANRGIFSTAHSSFLPDGTLLGTYGRAVHASTRDQCSNGKGDSQRRNAHIPRQALREALLAELPPSAVQWSKRLLSFSQEDADERSGGPVSLHFEDGTTQRADFLIGADGIWSSVRAHLVAPTGDPAPLTYLGVVVILGRAVCDHPLLNQQVFQTLDGRGTRVYAMPFTDSSAHPHSAQPGSPIDTGPGGGQGFVGKDPQSASSTVTGSEPSGASASGDAGPMDGAAGGGGTARLGNDACEEGGGRVAMWQLSFELGESEARAFPRDGSSLLEEARRRVAGWHPPIETLLGATLPTDVTGYPAYDRPVPTALRDELDHGRLGLGMPGDVAAASPNPQRYDLHSDPHRGAEHPPMTAEHRLIGRDRRCTLLGDAAHPMSPFKGQGANQALLDAVDLARALRRSALGGGERDWRESVAEFEARMLSRARSKVAASREAASALHTPAAIAPSNCTRAAAAKRERENKHEADHHADPA
jgi:salicylate hydroxylase